jgi:hypothetical protein
MDEFTVVVVKEGRRYRYSLETPWGSASGTAHSGLSASKRAYRRAASLRQEHKDRNKAVADDMMREIRASRMQLLA